MGRPLFVSAAQGDVSVEGRIQPAPSGRGWLAVIAIASSDGKVLGTRALNSAEASCRALDEQLALVIALMIDPEATAAEPGKAPVEAAPQAPPAPPRVIVQRETVLVPVPTPTPPKPETWRGGAHVGPVFGVGMLPGVACGLGVRLMIDPPWSWPVLVEGSIWRESRATEQGGAGLFRLALAGASLCPVQLGRARTRALICAGGHVGSLRMQSEGYDINREQERLAVDLALTGRVTHRIAGPLVVTAGAGLLAPIARDRFFVRVSDGSAPEVFRMAPIAAQIDLGLGVELP